MVHNIDTRFLYFVKNIYCDFDKQYSGNHVFNMRPMTKQQGTPIMIESGTYISPRLRKQINSLVNFNTLQGTCNLFGVDTRITISKPLKYSQSKLSTILDLIAFMIYYCTTINTNFNNLLEIKVILSPFKKTLTEGSGLSAYNVNSGFSQSDYSNKSSKIVVYREEEVIKVLVHELLHAFNIDCKSNSGRSKQQFADLFQRKGGITVNETFTDAYACLLNVTYCSICLSKSNKYLGLENIFVTLLRKETLHILKMGDRVVRKAMQQETEPTNILAYYGLKALLWINLNDFVMYLTRHMYMVGSCNEFISFIQRLLLEYNIKNIVLLSNILKIHYHNKKNIRTPQNTLKKYMKYIKLIKPNSIRMSSIDIL